MKKFKFRLQTLLDQRKSREEQLLAELGDLRREEVQEMEKLDALWDKFGRLCEEIESALGKSTSVIEVARLDEYAKTTKDDAELQKLTLEAVRERVEAKRQEVVKAMQDRQVLEALRDKQEQEYMKAIQKAEQDELDEMASVRYARAA